MQRLGWSQHARTRSALEVSARAGRADASAWGVLKGRGGGGEGAYTASSATTHMRAGLGLGPVARALVATPRALLAGSVPSSSAAAYVMPPPGGADERHEAAGGRPPMRPSTSRPTSPTALPHPPEAPPPWPRISAHAREPVLQSPRSAARRHVSMAVGPTSPQGPMRGRAALTSELTHLTMCASTYSVPSHSRSLIMACLSPYSPPRLP
jgi:hypothetical protein